MLYFHEENSDMRPQGKARTGREQSTDRDKNATGAPPQAAPKSLDKATDNADRLAYLQAKYGATYSRENVDGKVRMTLHVTGEGDSNDEALANLIRQLGAN
jgi:hypothetical protein